MREALHQQQGLTVHNNAFTMGLSTIAIAMGFMSETVLLDNQRKVLASLKELGFSGTRLNRAQQPPHSISRRMAKITLFWICCRISLVLICR